MRLQRTDADGQGGGVSWRHHEYCQIIITSCAAIKAAVLFGLTSTAVEFDK